MNFEKDSVPVLAMRLKDNCGNNLKFDMATLKEGKRSGLHELAVIDATQDKSICDQVSYRRR